jgi:hypothetical protein
MILNTYLYSKKLRKRKKSRTGTQVPVHRKLPKNGRKQIL